MRIDHIGSTSIPNLAAKPIVDIQVSVEAFDPMERIAGPLRDIGYVWREDNPDLAKRYFREQAGRERSHVHVRLRGSWHEQWALLFRDYMRVHDHERAAFAALKQNLAVRYRHDRRGYTSGKADYLWSVMRRADQWARDTGWRPAASDA